MAYAKPYYIKYQLNYSLLRQILEEKNKSKINFFIDLNSICKGFYRKDTIIYEIAEYGRNKGQVSGQLILELRNYLNDLNKSFIKYDPFFVIFYDDGLCLQNKSILSTYKCSRSVNSNILEDSEETDLFKRIKKLYFLQIKEHFSQKPDKSFVMYSHDYETDLVPHYCLKYNIYDASDSDVLNVILSIDKDLLQSCEYSNTVQCISGFKPNSQLGKYEIFMDIYDKHNALRYIYNNFQEGILTAKFIPMVLSLSGDKVDDVIGLNGIGAAKAIKLIEKNKVPPDLDSLRLQIKDMPEIIQKNIDVIIRNYKLISFDEQIKRLPKEFLK